MSIRLRTISFGRSTGFIVICIFVISFSSCGGRNRRPDVKHAAAQSKAAFSAAEFARNLDAALPETDTLGTAWTNRRIPDINTALTLVYQLNNYEPLWLDEEGILQYTDTLLSELDSLQWDGLPEERYRLEQLRQLRSDVMKAGTPLADILGFDTLCTRAYLLASRDLLLGATLPRKADTLWYHSNDSSWNAWRNLAAMIHSGSYPSLSAYRSTWAQYRLMYNAGWHYASLAQDSLYRSLQAGLSPAMTDSLLTSLLQRQMPWLKTDAADSLPVVRQLVRGAQYYFGQRVTGKMDTVLLKKLGMPPDSVRQLIGLNMERMRWMEQSPGKDYIIVPVPLMELFLVHQDRAGMQMRAVVGKPSRQTPSLNANMANVVLSPSWGVPPTILKKDVAPGLAKNGAAYLARKGLKAYDARGKVINAGKINASNYNRFSYRQDPGARNALGEVKFNLPNKWDIYLHDTPHKEDFPNRNRAKSSGCIRVARPKELAEYILREMEGKTRFSLGYIDSIISTRRTRFEILQHKIPVHIVYITAYPDSSMQALRFLDDIYYHDVKMQSKMATMLKKS